jgi:competence protein ComEC
VPHHGSRYQELPFLESLGSRLAVISVGADNDYGHPAPETVDALEATGEAVLRTDRDGDVAVVERDGRLSAVTSR